MPRDAGVNDLRLPAVAPDIWETFVLVTRLQLSREKAECFWQLSEKSVAQRFCEAFVGARSCRALGNGRSKPAPLQFIPEFSDSL